MTDQNKLKEIIKTGDFRSFRKIFANAESLCANRELLPMMVESGEAKFLDKVLKRYFGSKHYDLMFDFLNTPDEYGNIMNYHYFHDWLSPNITTQTDKAFGVEKAVKIERDDAKRMSELYEIIRDYKSGAVNSTLEGDLDDLQIIHDMFMSSSGKPAIKKDGEVVELDYPQIFLLMASRSIPPVVLLTPCAEGKKKETLAQRAYSQLDFPEEFVKLADSLNNVQKEWDELYRDEYLAPIAEHFIKHNGLICVEESFAGRERELFACMESTGKREHVRINDSKKFFNPINPLTHELGHCADDEAIADSVIFKYGFMLSILSSNVSFERMETIDNAINGGYVPNVYIDEFVANLVQNANINSPCYQKDHLYKNLYKLYGTYAHAKNNGQTEVVERILTMSDRLPNKPEFDRVYEATDNYLWHEFMKKEGKRKKNLYNILNAHPQRAFDRIGEVMAETETFGSGDVKAAEKQLTLYLISELRAINGIVADKRYKKCSLPQAAKGRGGYE